MKNGPFIVVSHSRVAMPLLEVAKSKAALAGKTMRMSGKPKGLMARYSGKFCDWTPFHRGGETTVLFLYGNEVLARGVATCSLSDNFCKKTGRTLAMKRALKEFDEKYSGYEGTSTKVKMAKFIERFHAVFTGDDSNG